MRLLLVMVMSVGVLAPVWGQYLEGVINIGEYQAQVFCNPISNKIYTSNHDDNTVTIIDGATRQIIAKKSVPNTPWYFCLNTVSNRVYCLCVYSNRLAIINGVTDSVKRLTIPHGGANAFAYNAVSNRLYAGCDDGYVVVVDGAGDTVLYEVNLGTAQHISGMVWNPATNHLFCAVGQDSVFVLDCLTDEVRARWYTVRPWSWCFSPVTGRVYGGGSNRLYVFSPRGDSILATILRGVQHLCAVPFPDKVYIDDGWVYVLDGSANIITDTIPYGGGAMVCDMAKGKVYVLGPGINPRVFVVDARADTLLVTIPLPAFNPQGICWNPIDGRVYVSDQQGDSVYVLRDTTSGIAEAEGTGPRRVGATLVRRTYFWSEPDIGQVLDIAGRKVAELQPGANDVGRLPAGVYAVVSKKTSLTTKFVKVD